MFYACAYGSSYLILEAMKRFILSLTLAIFSASISLMPAAALAKTSPGKGMEISPLVIDDTVSPGQQLTRTIHLRNLTSVGVIATPEVHDFTASGDESGNPNIDTKDTTNTSYSLRHWITGLSPVHLNAGQSVTVDIPVSVPEDAEPGGHYGAVLFTLSADATSGSSSVALGASIGTLFLLRVTGTVTEKLALQDFYTINHAGDRSAWHDSGPINFVVRVKNLGSVHEKPEGNIAVTDMLGRKVGTVIVNDKNGNALPGSIRRFDQTLPNTHLFGIYWAKLSLSYADGQKITKTIAFFVVPWQLIILLVLALLIVIYIVRTWMRKYNEHILRQARRAARQQQQR